jgi:N-dimethylarginine dimethylaminohydrolase
MHYTGIGLMSKFSKINSWDEFSPLKTILLGSVFAPEFFNDIKNKKTEYALKKVFDETIEDLDNFKTTMEQHGIKVHQSTPDELGYESSISAYVSEDGKMGYHGMNESTHDITRTNLIPAPPLQVRDETIIMGNEVFVTELAFTVHMMREKYVEWFGEENCNFDVLDGKIECRRTDRNITSLLRRQRAGDQFLNVRDASKLTQEEKELISSEQPLPGFCAPNITRIGKKCLVDIWQTPDIKQVLEEHYPQFDYHEIDLFGHDDSVFSVLKPGLVIAAEWVRKYNIQKIFPNWEIMYFDDPNWSQVDGWKNLKSLNKGKFWVPGEEENNAFTEFVGKWLDNWTGEVEETIFDVNCLVVDDKYVVVNSDSPELTNVLHKHNMEPIFCPLRHRFFFDGGWHCLTLDIERDGNQIDYGL